MKSTVYWIEGPWQGRLAIVPRPRGGGWLEDEVKGWREEGIDVVVSALTAQERNDLELTDEEDAVRAEGMDYRNLPIEDRSTPSSMQAIEGLARAVETLVASGKNVAFHCRQGIGRSSLLAASVLLMGGVDLDTALSRIRESRGCPVPETSEQANWLKRFARQAALALGK